MEVANGARLGEEFASLKDQHCGIFEKLLTKARNEVDFCDIRYVQRFIETFSRNSKEVALIEHVKRAKGIMIRVLNRGAWRVVHIEDDRPKALMDALSAATKSVRSAKGKGILPCGAEKKAADIAGGSPSELGIIGRKWAQVLTSTLLPKLANAGETEIYGTVKEEGVIQYLVNSLGAGILTSRHYLGRVVVVTSLRGTKSKVEVGHTERALGKGASTNGDWDFEKTCLMLKEKLLRLDRASIPKEEYCPVVMAPPVTASFIHEVGHALEADICLSGMSPFDRCNERVASDCVTIVDDPTLHLVGRFCYDDEGVYARPIILIKEGFLREYLHSFRTATATGEATGGRGRSHDYRLEPRPRMSNICLMPGNEKFQDLLSRVDRGFLLLSCDRASVHRITGDFSLQVSEALMIRKGKPAETYTGMVVRGKLQEALLRVSGCSEAADLAFDGTECVKGEALPVGEMAPYILVDTLWIGPT